MVDSYILRSVAFSILLLLGACAGTPSPPETTALDTASTPVPESKPQPEPSHGAADLVDELKTAQELAPVGIALPDGRAAAARIAKRPAGTEVGYMLLDVETGQVLAELNADLPLIPASTTKLATAVVALDVLGAEHRYRTELLADGIVEHGVLSGDLILRGTGDPALDLADLLELAVQLGNLGIFRIDGRFLIDDTAFPVLSEIDPRQPAEAAYNPGIGPLSVAFNRVRVAWSGGGTTPITLPPLDEARFVATSPSLLPAGGVGLEAVGDEAVVWQVADRGRRRMASLPVKDPGLHAGRVFRQFARSQGILLDPPQRGAAPASARLLAFHQSAPMRNLLRDMLVYSNNMMAEMIGLAAAQRLSNQPLPGLEAAGTLVVQHLGRLMPEVDWSSATLGNHSGLDARRAPDPASARRDRPLRLAYRCAAGAAAWRRLVGHAGRPLRCARPVAPGLGQDRHDELRQRARRLSCSRPATARRYSRPWCRTSAPARPTTRAARGRAETPAASWNARARALQDGLVEVWLRPLPTS